MVFLLVLAAAVVAGLALGGKLGALMGLRLHAAWLIHCAIALQLIAFPVGFLPWTTDDELARWLWLGSYACLLCAAALNLHVRGVLIVAAGMLSNVVAIVANGGLMPALPKAAEAMGMAEGHQNSVTAGDPRVEWLVDRWAAPDWLPLANVYSVGDVLLALGCFVLVLAAMQVPVLRRLPSPRLALR